MMTTYWLDGMRQQAPKTLTRVNSSESGLGIAESDIDSASTLDAEHICHVSDDPQSGDAVKPQTLFSMPHLPSAGDIDKETKLFTDIFDMEK